MPSKRFSSRSLITIFLGILGALPFAYGQPLDCTTAHGAEQQKCEQANLLVGMLADLAKTPQGTSAAPEAANATLAEVERLKTTSKPDFGLILKTAQDGIRTFTQDQQEEIKKLRESNKQLTDKLSVLEKGKGKDGPPGSAWEVELRLALAWLFGIVSVLSLVGLGALFLAHRALSSKTTNLIKALYDAGILYTK